MEIKQKLKLEHLEHAHSNDDALRKQNIKENTNRQVLTDWPCLFSSVYILDQDFQKLMGINLGGCESPVARKICEKNQGKTQV